MGAGTFGQFEDEVRPPLPVIREALYDDAMLYGYASFSCLLHFGLALFIMSLMCTSDHFAFITDSTIWIL